MYTAISNAPFVPSPYLQNGTFNPEYSKGLNQFSNALSDFNGKSNTDYFVNLGEKYVAANVAKNYKIENVGDID
jgi:negative regulator of sigma E activity